jgi:uncharacterized delta-60 repeat protein
VGAFVLQLLPELLVPSRRRRKARCAGAPEILESRHVLAAGDLDTTFDDDGLRVENLSSILPGGELDSGDVLTGVAVQTDGKVVVSGWAAINDGMTDENGKPLGIQTDRSNVPNQVAFVARYLSTGSLDTTFGKLGIKFLPHPTTLEPDQYWLTSVANDVAIQSDGKVVALKTTLSGLDSRTVPKILQVARLLSNGQPDTSFSADGFREVGSGASEGQSFWGTAVAISPQSGRIAVSGYEAFAGALGSAGELDYFYRPFVAVFLPSGAFDTTFSGDGRFGFDPSVETGKFLDIAFGPDDSLYASGYSTGANGVGQIPATESARLLVAKFTPNGNLAYRTEVPQGNQAIGRTLDVRPDGSVFVGGFTDPNGTGSSINPVNSVDHVQPLIRSGSATQRGFLARVGPTGALDEGYGTSGFVLLDPNSFSDVTSIAPRPAGGVYVAGHAQQDFAVGAFSDTGNPLTSSFPTLRRPVGTELDIASAIQVQSDGKLLLAGYLESAGDRNAALMRLDGEPTPPTDITLSGSNVPENAPVGTSVGTFSTVDPDTANPSAFTYALVPGIGGEDNALFAIGSDGRSLIANATFDFEVQSSRSVLVRVTDPGGLTLNKAFTVSIGNVNERPAADSDSVLRSAGTAPVVIRVLDNDTDPDNSPNAVPNAGLSVVSVTQPQGGTVTIDSGALTVTFTPSSGSSGATSFQYTISDGTLTATATVFVNTMNSAPVLDNRGSPLYIAGVGTRLPRTLTDGLLITEFLATGANGVTFSDADAGAVRGVAITTIDKTFGVWQYTTVASPAEGDWIDMDAAGPLSDASALLLKADATTRIRMKSTLKPHHTGTVAEGFLPLESKLDAGLMFRAWDQTGGTAGGRGNTTANGGATPFSTATEALSTFFEARLFRSLNPNVQLNVYTLEAEFEVLIGAPFSYQDRANSSFTGFTVFLSPLTAAVPVNGLIRSYYGVQFNSDDGTETDMGYRYLTTNAGEAAILETLGRADKRGLRQGAYFRELGVNSGSAILGYIASTPRTGFGEMFQIYRTDLVGKPTRPPGTTEGSPTNSTRNQEQGDHVYTTNFAHEAQRLGDWRLEASRGFVRELSPALPVPPHQIQIRQPGDQKFIIVTKLSGPPPVGLARSTTLTEGTSTVSLRLIRQTPPPPPADANRLNSSVSAVGEVERSPFRQNFQPLAAQPLFSASEMDDVFAVPLNSLGALFE